MNTVYENYLETSVVGTEESVWKIQEIKVNYSKFFPADKNAHILDIGIGNGEMLHLLNDCGYNNAEGVDISPSTINACKARGYKCILVENTVDFLKQNKNKFALISMFHVIEHISKEDIIPLICACREALADDGCLLLETPNMANIDGMFMRYSDFSHVMGYTNLSLKQMLSICGFKKIKIFSPNILFKKNIKQKIWKLLLKIHNFLYKIERKIAGMNLPTVYGSFLSAVAYKSQEK